MRLMMLLLLSLLGLTQYHLWFGKNGIVENHEVDKQVTLANQSNDQLRERNAQMYLEIEDLKSGSQAVEERARNELGLVKEGETFFRIIPKEDN